jgi:hypothetical protein
MTDNFALFGTITLQEGILSNHRHKIAGIASHEGLTTYHKGEVFSKRKYIGGELRKSVEKLGNKYIPIFLNHEKPLPGCKATLKWDDKEDGVAYEGEVTDEVANMINELNIRSVSLNANPWVQGGGVKFADGVAPFGFVFEELSLIDPRVMEPGDKQTTLRFLEALEKTFEIDPKHVAEEKRKAFIEQLERQVPAQYLKNPPQHEQETETSKPQRELSACEKFRKRRQ